MRSTSGAIKRNFALYRRALYRQKMARLQADNWSLRNALHRSSEEVTGLAACLASAEDRIAILEGIIRGAKVFDVRTPEEFSALRTIMEEPPDSPDVLGDYGSSKCEMCRQEEVAQLRSKNKNLRSRVRKLAAKVIRLRGRERLLLKALVRWERLHIQSPATLKAYHEERDDLIDFRRDIVEERP